MSRKINNYGNYFEKPKITGKNNIFATRDVNQNNISGSNFTPQDFENLITEIKSALNTTNLDAMDIQGAEANLEIAKNQAQKEKPNSNLIVSSLTTAMNLIIQAGGTAKAIEGISVLLQKAISYAQTIF